MDGRNDGNFNFAFQISRDEISSCAVRMDYLNTVVFNNFDTVINAPSKNCPFIKQTIFTSQYFGNARMSAKTWVFAPPLSPPLII